MKSEEVVTFFPRIPLYDEIDRLKNENENLKKIILDAAVNLHKALRFGNLEAAQNIKHFLFEKISAGDVTADIRQELLEELVE